MADELRGTTQTWTVRSIERSLRSGCARVVRVCEFSTQILLPQATRWEEWQWRGTICNIFEVRTEVFLKSTSCFLRNSLFSANMTNYLVVYTYDSWRYPKKLSVIPCVGLWTLNRFIYIAAELCFWLEKNTPLIAAVSSENCTVRT